MIKHVWHFIKHHELALLGIEAGLLWWFLDTAAHVLVFQDGYFLDQVFPRDADELWTRLLTTFLFFGFGFYAQFATGKLKKTGDSLRASNQQLTASEQQLRAANQQLRASEAELTKEHSLLRTLIDNLPDAIYFKDAESRFIMANATTAHWMGAKSYEELIGKGDADFFPPKLAKGFRADEKKIIRSGRAIVNHEEQIVNQTTGEKIWSLTTRVPLLDGEGKVIEIVGIGRNITARKQAEEQLRAVNQQLVASGQQLRAANQQLDASNQQLRATEQQLRAANQQLTADEEELRKTHDELRESHDELEERVKERTANLADTNKKLRSEINERKRMEKKIVEHQERLRSLTSQLSTTAEQTRKHIAEAIHDDAIQTLIFLKMKFDDLRGLEPSNQFTNVLGRIENQTDDLIQRMRTLTFDLSSPMLYDLGLSAAIKDWLNREIEGRYNIKTRFEDDGRAKDLDEDLRVVLYRSVRELLANVVKHAQAKNVTVSRKKHRNKIVITVEDDGKSFTVPKDGLKYDTSGGFGLFTISERLSQYNGSLKIGRGETGGTQVVLTVPLREQENGNMGG